MTVRFGLLVLALLVAAPPAAAAPPGAERGLERAARAARVRAATAVQRRHEAGLLAHRDVVGVGTALGADGEPVIRVLTARPGVAGLPAALEGVPLRMRTSGRIHARRGATCESSGDGICQTLERWPLPVPIGVSIGHPAITAGTIGARVTDGASVFALSNNHVLANINLGLIGDAAIQPGTFDGGSVAAGDAIGTLHDFEPIVFCTGIIIPVCTQTNLFDAALAVSTPGELGFATPLGEFGSAPGYGAPRPLLHAAYGDPAVFGDEDLGLLQGLPVQKHGRTTGLTQDTIDTIQLTTDVCYDEFCLQVARFTDQIGIQGAFSAGGDSGSLVVTDDAVRSPVGLLFAGSATDTIVSRIDFVLDRFGVTIDDGGTTGPVTDAALQSLSPPSWALVNQTSTVSAVVRNVGTEPLPAIDVVLDDVTETTSATLTAPALAPGASAQLDFSWTPTQTGPHDLVATLQVADDDPANDQAAASGVSVLLEPPGLSLRIWQGSAHTDSWTPVSLGVDYGPDMVVVCTPLYDVAGLGPLVPRVRNASGTGFEVGLGRPWFGAFPGEETTEEVQCVVMRAGVYDEPGFRLEAVRLDGFTGKDDASSWVGQARSYAQAYTQPVVVGQVISGSGGGLPGAIGEWSAFWARGATAQEPPSAADLHVGRHTGEDPTGRVPETLAYVVVEAGAGLMEGRPYRASVSTESVRGVDDVPPYVVPVSPSLLAQVAVLGSAAMDGLEGGWPILYGAGAVQDDALHVAIEEDWYFDPERSHTTEQVAALVIGSRPPPVGCGLGPELVGVLGLLLGARKGRAAWRRGPVD